MKHNEQHQPNKLCSKTSEKVNTFTLHFHAAFTHVRLKIDTLQAGLIHLEVIKLQISYLIPEPSV